MLAGLNADATPVGEWCDAAWAAWAEFVGPELMAGQWDELTGEVIDIGPQQGAAPASSPAFTVSDGHGDDTVAPVVLRDLSDDDLRRHVPAYRRALEEGNEAKLAELDRHWQHTSGFAAGQGALVSQFGDAATRKGKRAAAASSVDDHGPAATNGSGFGLPFDPAGDF